MCFQKSRSLSPPLSLPLPLSPPLSLSLLLTEATRPLHPCATILLLLMSPEAGPGACGHLDVMFSDTLSSLHTEKQISCLSSLLHQSFLHPSSLPGGNVVYPMPTASGCDSPPSFSTTPPPRLLPPWLDFIFRLTSWSFPNSPPSHCAPSPWKRFAVLLRKKKSGLLERDQAPAGRSVRGGREGGMEEICGV